MVDDDRILLRSLTEACDKFCLSPKGTRLSWEDHIELALMFLDMADQILKRMIDNSTLAEGNTT